MPYVYTVSTIICTYRVVLPVLPRVAPARGVDGLTGFFLSSMYNLKIDVHGRQWTNAAALVWFAVICSFIYKLSTYI